MDEIKETEALIAQIQATLSHRKQKLSLQVTAQCSQLSKKWHKIMNEHYSDYDNIFKEKVNLYNSQMNHLLGQEAAIKSKLKYSLQELQDAFQELAVFLKNHVANQQSGQLQEYVDDLSEFKI